MVPMVRYIEVYERPTGSKYQSTKQSVTLPTTKSSFPSFPWVQKLADNTQPVENSVNCIKGKDREFTEETVND